MKQQVQEETKKRRGEFSFRGIKYKGGKKKKKSTPSWGRSSKRTEQAIEREKCLKSS